MVTVSVHDARNSLSRLIKQAQAGEETVITSHGRPVARLVPIRRPLSGSELANWLSGHRPVPVAARSRAQADADVTDERESWE